MKPLVVPALAGLLIPVQGLAAQDQATPARKVVQMAAQPQQKSVKELTDLYEKKVAKDFVQKGGWILDWDEASALARKEGKPIFAYFTRSYSY